MASSIQPFSTSTTSKLMIPRLHNLPLKRERNQINEMSLGRFQSILDAQTYLDFNQLKWHLHFSPSQLLYHLKIDDSSFAQSAIEARTKPNQ
jgi:hypothetical protein